MLTRSHLSISRYMPCPFYNQGFNSPKIVRGLGEFDSLRDGATHSQCSSLKSSKYTDAPISLQRLAVHAGYQ